MKHVAPLIAAVAFSAFVAATPARAQQASAPANLPASTDAEWHLDPTLEGRLRMELVRQNGLDADSITLGLYPGVQLTGPSGLSLLVEGEGTVALNSAYNGFPFASASSQRRPQYATVADPESLELNRLQLQYRSDPLTLTLGRQRLVFDDAKLVGNAGWRQNEQTFDAARAEARVGPVNLDLAYAISQRTVFGSLAGERTAYDGSLIFLNTGITTGPVRAKGFAYLLDYDAKEQAGTPAITLADAATVGLRVNATVKPSAATRLDVALTWASQSAWRDNPARYRVDYLVAEANLAMSKLLVTVGLEWLGSDGNHAFQRPTANQPRFEQYLTTPAKGLSDAYLGLSYRITGVPLVKTVIPSLTVHHFSATAADVDYGTGIEAALAMPLGKTTLLLKMTDFDGSAAGSSWTRFWIQADFAL